MSGLVSVIMPSYNTGEYIAASVGSVIAQTYTDWELIIVDDCSTDDTDAVLRPLLSDKRIRYIKNKVNSGAAVCRNRALREASGRWIAFLDSDDIWLPDKLDKQIRFMEEGGYAFTFTDYRTCVNGAWMPYVNTAPDIVNRRKMYNYCYFFTSTVMYEREKIGLIQIADLRKNNDYAMWLEAIERSDAVRLPECLSYYIKHDSSISSGSKFRLIKWHYILFRKGLGKGALISVIFTVNNLVHGVIKKIIYKRPIDGTP